MRGDGADAVSSEVVVRILVAAGLGAVIGFEREAAAQSAGLRTHLSVALGAALFGIVSTLGFSEFEARRELTNVQVDVARVASNVVVGIGFVGAGLIFRRGGHVHNLTTAASLWVSAAVGLAAGVGDHAAAGIATAVLVAALVLLRPVRTMVERRLVRPRRSVRIVLRPEIKPDELLGLLDTASRHVAVERCQLGRQDGCVVIEAVLRAQAGHHCREVTDVLAGHDDVGTLVASKGPS